MLISDVNLSKLPELNAVYACVLFKGHGKDRHDSQSYRTLSICPLLVKALDLYIRQLELDKWELVRPETQYQGEGSSHELAALLLTETVLHGLHTLNSPVYVLYLDARSCFDSVLRELLILELYSAGTRGETLQFINNRLANRTTYLEWDKVLMGPLFDELGLEQGGVGSSDYWKVFARRQLDMCQESGLGVQLFDQVVSSIGQADDCAVVSTDLHSIKLLLELNMFFSHTHKISFNPPKTVLQVFSKPSHSDRVYIDKIFHPVTICDTNIEFSDSGEHVGIVRSVTGNMPNILSRITAHCKALYSVLHTGVARGHWGNPAAYVHVERLYASPVLLSGLAAMYLKKGEISLLEMHYKKTIQSLLRLPDRTPATVVHFLSGTLPFEGLLHLRQLTLLGMISRQPGSVLYKHGLSVYVTSAPSRKSWFLQIAEICCQYKLSHPISLLENPLSKGKFKSLVKSKVYDYWEKKLRCDASTLSSLEYFKCHFYSLNTAHLIFTTAGSNPFEVKKATLQATMLSGRYRCEKLCRFWSKDNKAGLCSFRECAQLNMKGDINHILISCQPLSKCKRENNECYPFSHR